jgi:hypothetical protein
MRIPGGPQIFWAGLFDRLSNYGSDGMRSRHAELIGNWAAEHHEVIDGLRELGLPPDRLRATARGTGHDADVGGLYALSRIFDILLAPYQPISTDPAALNPRTGVPWWTGILPPKDAVLTLADVIGCRQIAEGAFHPFFHEVVAVLPADDPEAEVELAWEIWPGFMAGSLLLARSGVVVRAGHRVINPGPASASPMHWAWWRRNRPAADLSHGWRRSLRVGTDFRRDYVIDGHFCYNVDASRFGSRDIGPVVRDLIRFRCQTSDGPVAGAWPWDEGFAEERAA